MTESTVKIGKHIINLSAIADVHWDGGKLWVNFIGGRFATLVGSDATKFFDLLARVSFDLDSKGREPGVA